MHQSLHAKLSAGLVEVITGESNAIFMLDKVTQPIFFTFFCNGTGLTEDPKQIYKRHRYLVLYSITAFKTRIF